MLKKPFVRKRTSCNIFHSLKKKKRGGEVEKERQKSGHTLDFNNQLQNILKRFMYYAGYM